MKLALTLLSLFAFAYSWSANSFSLSHIRIINGIANSSINMGTTNSPSLWNAVVSNASFYGTPQYTLFDRSVLTPILINITYPRNGWPVANYKINNPQIASTGGVFWTLAINDVTGVQGEDATIYSEQLQTVYTAGKATIRFLNMIKPTWFNEAYNISAWLTCGTSTYFIPRINNQQTPVQNSSLSVACTPSDDGMNSLTIVGYNQGMTSMKNATLKFTAPKDSINTVFIKWDNQKKVIVPQAIHEGTYTDQNTNSTIQVLNANSTAQAGTSIQTDVTINGFQYTTPVRAQSGSPFSVTLAVVTAGNNIHATVVQLTLAFNNQYLLVVDEDIKGNVVWSIYQFPSGTLTRQNSGDTYPAVTISLISFATENATSDTMTFNAVGDNMLNNFSVTLQQNANFAALVPVAQHTSTFTVGLGPHSKSFAGDLSPGYGYIIALVGDGQTGHYQWITLGAGSGSSGSSGLSTGAIVGIVIAAVVGVVVIVGIVAYLVSNKGGYETVR